MTIGEFESRVTSFPNRRMIDKDQQTMLLREAADFEGFASLKIERSFLRFIKSSPSLLSFFVELSKERVSFDQIAISDTYDEYGAHIAILQTLYERYQTLLEERGYIDSINAPAIYQLNESYLKQLSEVTLHFEGYLTRYERELFSKIAQKVSFKLITTPSSYTLSLYDDFFGFSLQPEVRYTLNISKGEICDEVALKSRYRLKHYTVPSRIAQVVAVKKALHDLTHLEGISADDIALIVPDESIIPLLRLYDTKRNLNFGMGRAFSETILYKRLQGLYFAATEEGIEYQERLKRMQQAEIWEGLWDRVFPIKEALHYLKNFGERGAKGEIKQRYEEALYQFSKLEDELIGTPFKEVVHLFLERLSHLRLDMPGGGKVTVMGPLETRGVPIKSAIIVDFNDGYVPKPIDKDLYLNTAIRYHCGLPTRKDRQNLQKDYYHKLLSNIEKGVIISVDKEDALPSPFIKSLGIACEAQALDEAYLQLLYPINTLSIPNDALIEREIDLTAYPLSATRLKDYIQCKRRYFYKYIERLKEYELPETMPKANHIGTMLHEALYEVYHENPTNFKEAEGLLHKIQNALYKRCDHELYLYFQSDLWLKRFSAFAKLEAQRYAEGYRVHALEKRYETHYEGISIYGVIDRIDTMGGDLYVLDYKSGQYTTYTSKTVENAEDFQLEFYTILAGEALVAGSYFYDLKAGILVRESEHERKLERLKEHINELKAPHQSFDRCEDRKHCRYCPYQIMCGRI